MVTSDREVAVDTPGETARKSSESRDMCSRNSSSCVFLHLTKRNREETEDTDEGEGEEGDFLSVHVLNIHVNEKTR